MEIPGQYHEMSSSLLREYAKSFEEYLAGAGEGALDRANEVGRTAVAKGVSVLELAAIHHRAMLSLLLHAVSSGKTAEEVRAVGMLCACCPAWYTSAVGSTERARLLEKSFADGLSEYAITCQRLRSENEALRRLSEAREGEARRIAQALHDEAGQLLASVHLALEDIARQQAPAIRDLLRDVRKQLDHIEVQLRRLSHELRPPILDHLGLVPALQFLTDGVSQRARVSITLEGDLAGRLPPTVEMALYRIVQEALTNVTKHASASHVSVSVRREPADKVVCSVWDDGIGFDVPADVAAPGGRGLGLLGIEERLRALGGTLVITSQRGGGTELVATIPLDGPDKGIDTPSGTDQVSGASDEDSSAAG
mgnify:CR=1 FL=1